MRIARRGFLSSAAAAAVSARPADAAVMPGFALKYILDFKSLLAAL